MLNNRKINLVYIIVLVLFLACQDDRKGTLEGGINYEFITKANGEETKNGDFIAVHLTYQDENDSVLASSLEMGIPYVNRKDSTWGSKGTFEDCLNLMSKGDSAVFKIPAKILFKDQMPPDINAESIITVSAGLHDILNQEEYMAMVTEWQNAQRLREKEAYLENILETQQELIASDGEEIDQYLTKNNLTAQITDLGIRYIITEEGEGENAVAGDNVRVNYVGKLLDGTVFDSSFEEIAKSNNVFTEGRPYEPYMFQLGYGNVIFGWDDGLTMLNQGAKATFLIPSPLAYGESARGEIIKENSILVFEIELVEIIK